MVTGWDELRFSDILIQFSLAPLTKRIFWMHLKVCYDGVLMQLLCFCTLAIVLSLI
jgi:hypothetical protein